MMGNATFAKKQRPIRLTGKNIAVHIMRAPLAGMSNRQASEGNIVKKRTTILYGFALTVLLIGCSFDEINIIDQSLIDETTSINEANVVEQEEVVDQENDDDFYVGKAAFNYCFALEKKHENIKSATPTGQISSSGGNFYRSCIIYYTTGDVRTGVMTIIKDEDNNFTVKELKLDP